jgi:hypothetical protein
MEDLGVGGRERDFRGLYGHHNRETRSFISSVSRVPVIYNQVTYSNIDIYQSVVFNTVTYRYM